TAHLAVFQERAGVRGTRGKLYHRAPHVHVPGGGRGFIVADVVGVAVAELAVKRVSPTAHPAVFQEGARVPATGGKLYHSAADVDVARGGGVFIITDGVGVAVPQCSSRSLPPTPHPAVFEQGARVSCAGD